MYAVLLQGLVGKTEPEVDHLIDLLHDRNFLIIILYDDIIDQRQHREQGDRQGPVERRVAKPSDAEFEHHDIQEQIQRGNHERKRCIRDCIDPAQHDREQQQNDPRHFPAPCVLAAGSRNIIVRIHVKRAEKNVIEVNCGKGDVIKVQKLSHSLLVDLPLQAEDPQLIHEDRNGPAEDAGPQKHFADPLKGDPARRIEHQKDLDQRHARVDVPLHNHKYRPAGDEHSRRFLQDVLL